MVDDGGVSGAGEPGGARSVVAIEREVAVVAGVRNAADARLVELVAEALARGQWSGSRIYTPVQWVMVRAGVSRVAAQRIVALARRASELPETMRRFAEGRISVDQAAVVARFVPAEFEASVAEMAESATVAQLVRSTKEYDFDTDAPERDDAPEPTPQEPVPEAPERGVERSVSFGTDDGGQWWAQIKLPADEGMEVEASWRAERDRLVEAGRKAARDKAAAAKAQAAGDDGRAATDGVEPSGGASWLPSWADAFMGVVRSAIASSGAAALGRVRAQVLVHLERPSAGDRAWRASTTMGATLPDSLRRLMTCDADARIVGWSQGAPVDVGRSQRTVPDRVRRIVEHRDQGCRVPGCDGGMWLEVHHIIHWEDGGPTDVWNLVCLCPRHHRAHHRGELGITGDANAPGGLRFTDRYGQEISGASRARPPTPDDIPDVAPCPGPTGERLDPTAITFTRRQNPAA